MIPTLPEARQAIRLTLEAFEGTVRLDRRAGRFCGSKDCWCVKGGSLPPWVTPQNRKSEVTVPKGEWSSQRTRAQTGPYALKGTALFQNGYGTSKQ